MDEAVAIHRKAIDLTPDLAEAHSNLLFTLNYTAALEPAQAWAEARQFGRMVAGRVSSPFKSWTCAIPPERLRVGLVSGDLCRHPVGYFLEAVLGRIDPRRLELVAYPTVNNDDELSARLRRHLAVWAPLVGLGDEAAARRIHGDGIHVLVDLSGHTAHNRLPLFAWRPAPVQATWLGYFATTGVAEIDYILADPHVAPPEEDGDFTEAVWRLPESYLCFTPPDLAIDVAPSPAQASGTITFGCFNNLSKINDRVVALWARSLTAVPGSLLFLKTKQLSDRAIREDLQRRFAAHDIAGERLILEGSSPRAELLQSYHRVDIALDPFPYPGGTTSVEALWMGVPVLTRRGDRFLGHLGESITRNAGLADWIADDDDDFVIKAAAHASDVSRLSRLRAGLRHQVLASPLFDAERFAHHFEAAMWGMWQARTSIPATAETHARQPG